MRRTVAGFALVAALAACDLSRCPRCAGTGTIDCSQCERGVTDCPQCVDGMTAGTKCRYCAGVTTSRAGTVPCQICNSKGVNTCFSCSGSGKR